MSTPRLAFLYPHLFRRPVAVEATPALRISWSSSHYTHNPQYSQRQSRRRALHSSSCRRNDIQPNTQNSAQRAIPLGQPGSGQFKPSTSDTGLQGRKNEVSGRRERDSTERSEEQDDGLEQEEDARDRVIDVGASSRTTEETDARESHPAEPMMSTSLELSTRPLERVLHMEPPSSSRDGEDGDGKRHMRAPPYVHHFDTYSLVRDLEHGGFTQHQSISLMKAVRGLLASNLQVAREELVSKSDVENESYLFRAACSELKTEVENGRRTAADRMRSERSHLQHEADILGQRLTQETQSLRDELKGVFDDRKMTVRMEQRAMESHIQELNYKIQSELNGQSKGEVEGLRWFLTRRAAFVIGGLALAVILGIQYSVHSAHTRREQLKNQEAEDGSTGEGSSSGAGSSASTASTASYTVPSRSTATQTSGDNTDTVLSSMDTKTGQNYVSLG